MKSLIWTMVVTMIISVGGGAIGCNSAPGEAPLAQELSPVKEAMTAEDFFNRGNVLCSEGKYDEAIAEFDKALKLDPKFAAAWTNRGLAYNSKGQYDQAIADFSKAIELWPENAIVYSNRGLAYSNNGQYDLAIADYNKVIQLDPENAVAWEDRGNVYTSKGQYDLAVADYSKAIELEPNDTIVYYNRGLAYFYKGQFEPATADFSKFIEFNPEFVSAYRNRAEAYYNIGQHDLAIADFNKAIELDPNHAITYCNRGIVYLEKGQCDLAIVDFNRAIELDPQLASAYANRGAAYMNKGMNEPATADLNKAITLAKDSATSMFARKMLENMGKPSSPADNAPPNSVNQETPGAGGSQPPVAESNGQWPTFSDENRIVIYPQQVITGSINDDRGNLTYRLNPVLLRACGGKPGKLDPPYRWTAPSLPGDIRLSPNGLVTDAGSALQEGTRTFTVEVTDGTLTARGTVTLVVTRYDVSSEDGIPGVSGAWSLVQQWPQEMVDQYPLPDAKAGQYYAVTLPVFGGEPPYKVDIADVSAKESDFPEGGSIESGFIIDDEAGVFYGIISPQLAGKSLWFKFSVKDSSGETDHYPPEYQIRVLP